MKYLILIISIFMSFSCANNKAYNDAEKICKDVDSLFSSQYPSNEPGVSVLIMKEDSVIFSQGYGIADLSTGLTIDDNTFFNIASVSKQFSAVAIMMLAEEGKLSLDDNLKKWFPDFQADFFNDIKLSHLLSHTSGIPDSRDRSNREFVTKATDVESYSYIAKLDSLNFEPGSKYEYMNPTFQLMYSIIEMASGIPFETFMKERIFNPSGMEETLYFEEGRFIPRMAHGYLQNGDTKVFEEFDYGEESFFATKADGGIYTSVREFINWEKVLRKNILISEKMTNDAHSPKIKIEEIVDNYYGYGWFIEKKTDYPTKIYHTGDNGGFQILAARYPEENILILIFSNRNDKNREENAFSIDQILKKAGWL